MAKISIKVIGGFTMIKGCTKRVIVVKDIESNFFDEAFFIVKPQSTKRAGKESDYINEAHRIVKSDLPGENAVNVPLFVSSPKHIKINKKHQGFRDALIFMFGFGVSVVFCTFIYYAGILL